MRAFVDTSAFIAFREASETYHDLFGRLFDQPPALVTTSLVIAEGHAWFLKKYDSYRALQFLALIEELKCLEITAIGKHDLEKGREYLQKFSDQDLTLTDACGLWCMKKEKVKSCWSTDRHLGLTGVPLAIHTY